MTEDRHLTARQKLEKAWQAHTAQNLVLRKVEVGTRLYEDYASSLPRLERLDSQRARLRFTLWFRNTLVVCNPSLGADELRVARSENSDVRYE